MSGHQLDGEAGFQGNGQTLDKEQSKNQEGRTRKGTEEEIPEYENQRILRMIS